MRSKINNYYQMGIQTSTSGGGGNYETEVILNVYDLTPLNNYVAWFGFGIFHSGIEGQTNHLFSIFICLLCFFKPINNWVLFNFLNYS